MLLDMNYLYVLSSIGLFLDIIGVIMLFKYGLPSEVSKEGNVMIVLEQTDDEQIKKWKRYNLCSKVALSIIILGFVLQIVPSVIQIFPS